MSTEDPLDLYRFDVPGRSDVRVRVDATKDLGIRLLNGAGGSIRSGERGVELVRVLTPGTYYVALTPGEQASRYRIRVLVRQVTQTAIAADAASRTKVKPGAVVQIRTTTTPAPGSGTTRVQADFFDVATRTWVFRKSWDVAGRLDDPVHAGRGGQLARPGDVPRHAEREPEPLGVREARRRLALRTGASGPSAERGRAARLALELRRGRGVEEDVDRPVAAA